MSEQPSEVAVDAPSADVVTPAEPASLETVLSKFTADVPASPPESVTPQPAVSASAPASPPAQPSAPTPSPEPDKLMDPAAWAEWKVQQELGSRLAPIESYVSESKAREAERLKADARAQQDADVNAAVQKVIETAGDGVNEKRAFGAIAAEMSADPRLKALFDARNENPEAWNSALEAVGHSLKLESVAKLDPQTAEDQRAVSAAFSTTESGPSGSKAPVAAVTMSDAEFGIYWDSIR